MRRPQPDAPWPTAAEQRLIEQSGLVDAEGVVYLAAPFPVHGSSWPQRQVGHLVELRSPDLSSWLSREPDPDTIDDGRRALKAAVH